MINSLHRQRVRLWSGRSEVQISGRSNRTQRCQQLAPLNSLHPSTYNSKYNERFDNQLTNMDRHFEGCMHAVRCACVYAAVHDVH